MDRIIFLGTESLSIYIAVNFIGQKKRGYPNGQPLFLYIGV
jgi:hypothetical protein